MDKRVKLMTRALFVTIGFMFILVYSLHLKEPLGLCFLKALGTALVLIAYYYVIDHWKKP